MTLSQPFYIEKRDGKSHLNLDGKWDFACLDAFIEDVAKINFEHTATLPSSAYMNMYEAGLLPHPYEADNSKLYQHLDEKVWYYRRTFTLDVLPDAQKQNAYLCFDGISYYSKVWLNGELLGEHDGMFGGPVVDVADKLKQGENELIVEAVAFNYYRDADKKAYGKGYWGYDSTEIIPWNISKDRDTSNAHFTVIGIWRSVRMEIVPKTHISRPYLYTKSICEKGENGLADARLSLEISIASDKINELACLLSDESHDFTFTYRGGLSGVLSDKTVGIRTVITDPETGAEVFNDAEDFTLYDYDKSGIVEKMRECQFYTRDIDLKDIELWYPLGVGTGKAKLYDVKIELSSAGVLLDTQKFTTGIRVVEQTRSAGRKYRQCWNNYRFSVNGKDFFLKGMNWMPVDFLYTISDEDYKWTLEQVKNCGIQFLRVWSGGGMPEDDRFYDLCDSMGILVWQDAFLANSARPKWNSKTLENQLCYNLFRMRNHPSLAVYCGGNEHQAYHPENNAAMYIIQRNIENIDPQRSFYRVSPDGGSMHSYRDWEPVWYRKAYRDLPLMAECGIHSFPCAKSLRQLISKKEFDGSLDGIMEESFRDRSPELINHFTEYRPDRIPRMLSRATHIESIKGISLSSLCEATQIAAYEFYQILVQSLRENYPFTTGLMPWVFKRTWTTTAIQMVDGLGETTAQYYAIKNNYAPVVVLASLCETDYAPGERVIFPVRVINESKKSMNVIAELDIFSPCLEKVFNKSKKLCINKDSHLTSAFECSFDIPAEWKDSFFFARTVLTSEDGKPINSAFYPLKCLSSLCDEEYRRDFRENPHENLYFENGPHIKNQIENAQKSVLSAEIISCIKNGERVSLEVKLEATAPTYPVKLEIADDKTTSYLSDNYFFLDADESKIVTMEIRNSGDLDRSLELCINAWNTQKLSIKL